MNLGDHVFVVEIRDYKSLTHLDTEKEYYYAIREGTIYAKTEATGQPTQYALDSLDFANSRWTDEDGVFTYRQGAQADLDRRIAKEKDELESKLRGPQTVQVTVTADQ